jgi:hypothetical protein
MISSQKWLVGKASPTAGLHLEQASILISSAEAQVQDAGSQLTPFQSLTQWLSQIKVALTSAQGRTVYFHRDLVQVLLHNEIMEKLQLGCLPQSTFSLLDNTSTETPISSFRPSKVRQWHHRPWSVLIQEGT